MAWKVSTKIEFIGEDKSGRDYLSIYKHNDEWMIRMFTNHIYRGDKKSIKRALKALDFFNSGKADGLSRQVGGVPYSFSKWRRESLKAYGNAIVPQIAEEIMSAIYKTFK